MSKEVLEVHNEVKPKVEQARATFQEVIKEREQQEAKKNAAGEGNKQDAQASQNGEHEKKEEDQKKAPPTYEAYILGELEDSIESGHVKISHKGDLISFNNEGIPTITFPALSDKPLTLDHAIIAFEASAKFLDEVQLVGMKDRMKDLQDMIIVLSQQGNSDGLEALYNKTAKLESIAQEQINERIPIPSEKTTKLPRTDLTLDEIKAKKIVPTIAREYSEVLHNAIDTDPAYQREQQERLGEVQKMVKKMEQTIVPEFDITSANVNLSEQLQQVISDFANSVTGREVSFDTDSLEVYVAMGDKKVTIGLPKDATLADIAKIAKLWNPEGASLDVPKKMQEFAKKLQQTALIMAQTEEFSDETIAVLYHTGEQLASLTEGETLQKTMEEIRGEAAKVDFSDEKKQQLYLEMIYGKGVTYTNESGLQESYYEKQFPIWQKRLLAANPDASITREDFDNYLIKRFEENSRYRSLVIRAVEKSFAKGNEGKAGKAMKDVAAQGTPEQLLLQTELNAWVEKVRGKSMPRDEDFTQAVHEALAKARMQPTENGNETLRDISAVTELFQSQKIVNYLKYAPKEILDALENGKISGEAALWEAACNIKSLYAKAAFEHLGYTVIPQLDGNHMFLKVVKITDGKIEAFFVDPSTPKQLEEKGVDVSLSGVRAITGETELQKLREDIESGNIPGNEVIISSVLHNAAMQLQEDGGNSDMIQKMLEEAVQLDPNNAMALYGLWTVTKNESYRDQALHINKKIEEIWEKNKMIGAFSPPVTPSNRAAQGILRRLQNTWANKVQGNLALNINELDYSDLEAAMNRLYMIQSGIDDTIPANLTSIAELDTLIDWLDEALHNPGVANPAQKGAQVKFQEAEKKKEEDYRQKRKDSLQFFQLSETVQEKIREIGPMEVFRDSYMRFAAQWSPGKMPDKVKFEQYEKMLGDMVTFIENLSPSNGRADWGYTSAGEILTAEEEKQLFRDLQGNFISAMTAAVFLEDPDSGEARQKAQGAINSLGIIGSERIKSLEEGTIGAILQIYTDQLELQRMREDGFLSSRSFAEVPEHVALQLIDQAEAGWGIFHTKYEEYKLSNPGNPEKAKALLKRDVIASCNIARWVAVASLDEAVVLSKGDPKGAGDFGDRYYAWNHYHDFVRFCIGNLKQRSLFIGDKKNIGPHKKWVTENMLREIGYMDDNDNFAFPIHMDNGKEASRDDIFLWAADAMYMYKLCKRSGRAEDSSWRMSPYLDYLYKLQGTDTTTGKPLDDPATGKPIENPRTRTPFIDGPREIWRKREALDRKGDLPKNSLGETDEDVIIKDYAGLKFGLWTQYHMLQTGIDADNNLIRLQKEHLLRGNIATYMPDKVMMQVYEFNFRNKDFVNFFNQKDCEYLDKIEEAIKINHPYPRPGDAMYYEYKARADDLSPDEKIASRRFEIFMKYVSPLMSQIRKEGYDKKNSIQTDFGGRSNSSGSGGDVVDDADLTKIKEYFSAQGVVGINVGTSLKIMMGGLTDLVAATNGTPYKDSRIAYEVANDVRYFPMQIRNFDKEDLLLNKKENRKELSLQLEALNRGLSRPHDDLRDYQTAADVTFWNFFKGDFNNEEEIVKAFTTACRALSKSFGEDASAEYLLNNAGFYEFAMALNGPYEFFDINWDVENKCLAAQYLGSHIQGKTREGLLDMHKKYFAHYMGGTSKDPEKAAIIERRLKKRIGIRTWDIWMKNRVPKGFLAVLLALLVEGINEIQPADLKAS